MQDPCHLGLREVLNSSILWTYGSLYVGSMSLKLIASGPYQDGILGLQGPLRYPCLSRYVESECLMAHTVSITTNMVPDSSHIYSVRYPSCMAAVQRRFVQSLRRCAASWWARRSSGLSVTWRGILDPSQLPRSHRHQYLACFFRACYMSSFSRSWTSHFPPNSKVWGSLLERGNAPGWMGGTRI